MSQYKLGVEVVSAHGLMPKDGHGSSSPCVELHFDGQKFRTTIKEKDLNPVWDERFYFNIADPAWLPELALEASVINFNKSTRSKSFLGKVQIAGTSFVPFADAVVMQYPLEKHGMFSRVKGELSLKVFLTNDPSIKPSNPLPAIDSNPNNPPPTQAHKPLPQFPILSTSTSTPPENKWESRHTFHSIPKKFDQHRSAAPVVSEPVRYVVDSMKPEPRQHRTFKVYSLTSTQQPADYGLKETSPFLGGGQIVGGRVIPAEKPASTYDLVEQMQYLFVRVVKARDLPAMDVTGSLDPYVEVKVGNYKGTTKHFEKKQNPEWNEVFAFSREQMQASIVEVVIKDKDLLKDDFVGIIRFEVYDVPTRVPPDSPLAPEWYRLEDTKGHKTKGELMLAVWMGTQADESFADAWQSDSVARFDASSVVIPHIKSKVYHAPRLWYVRVNIVEAQDIVIKEKARFPDVYVKAQLGNQVLRTRTVQARTLNPVWNEDLMLVAAEPFEDHLILSVEDRVGANKDEVLGRVVIPLGSLEKRVDDHIIPGRWFDLEKPVVIDVDQLKKDKLLSSRVFLRACLDGGYHVLDESTHYSSDLRPTAKQLWKPSIGLLELGILNAEGLHPMKSREGKGTSDTYCVAKYGHKWVRTRTIIDSLSPRYNEQYTWEVYDPATVVTVGVFDNCQLEKGSNGSKDAKIGKVRIRLSTLETGRVYTHSYPLLVLHPSGVKKMGEIHLAIRFSATSFVDMMICCGTKQSNWWPRGLVEWSHPSERKLSSTCPIWFGDVCNWKNPITTVLVHILFVTLVCFPELLLSTAFLYMFLVGLWNYRYRPRYPPHMNTKISHAEAVHPDELDEEFDSFPTSRGAELVRMRYDRLRSVAGRIQTVVGDLATQGERVQALLSWRDPRATSVFVLFCLMAALVLYVTPLQVLAALAGFYIMRHPRFRHRIPSAPLNFFRRLPARTDSML
ncbi:hypothetical protein OPV22_028520 [Ensete ventricosum]|uniref:C2 domain-containing protein n=1 Tax=Ensete ventricosum TaxID=4639 RepID=A0AAV8PYH1_ENSVE|nr:hypothetical protein OPV22_028520 [Ensete ventricosum]